MVDAGDFDDVLDVVDDVMNAAARQGMVFLPKRPGDFELFRVDVTLGGATPRPDALVAGSVLDGNVTARYLFGAPMQARTVKWTLTRSPLWDAPTPIREKFPQERWEFVGYLDEVERGPHDVAAQEATLTKTGTLPLKLTTEKSDGLPWEYSLEGALDYGSTYRWEDAIDLCRAAFGCYSESGRRLDAVAIMERLTAEAEGRGDRATIDLARRELSWVVDAEGELLPVAHLGDQLALVGPGSPAPRPAPEALGGPVPGGVPEPEVQHGVVLGPPAVADLEAGGALGDQHRQDPIGLVLLGGEPAGQHHRLPVEGHGHG